MKLVKTTETLSKTVNKHWYILPIDLQTAIKEHFDELKHHFSPINFYPQFLPDSWKQSKDLCLAFENYLKMLHEDGAIITESTVKSAIGLIYIKVKDDIITAINSYNYSAAKRYRNPYVFEQKEFQSQITSFAMPERKEIETVFLSYFSNITDNVIKAFAEFLKWSETTQKTVIGGKYLYKYVSDIAKLSDNSLGKVFSILRYLQENNTLTLPPNFQIIINYNNNKEKQEKINSKKEESIKNEIQSNLAKTRTRIQLQKTNENEQNIDINQVWNQFVESVVKPENKNLYESAILQDIDNKIMIHLDPQTKLIVETGFIRTFLKSKIDKNISIQFDNI